MKIYTTPGTWGVLDTDNPEDEDTIEFVTGHTVAWLLCHVNELPPATPDMIAALARGDCAGQATDGEA